MYCLLFKGDITHSSLIDPLKPGEKDFNLKVKSLVVWTFNHTQEETGGGTCSAPLKNGYRNIDPKMSFIHTSPITVTPASTLRWNLYVGKF